MIGRFRHALYSAIGTLDNGEDGANAPGSNVLANGASGAGGSGGNTSSPSGAMRVKYPYQRPLFLQVSKEKELSIKEGPKIGALCI